MGDSARHSRFQGVVDGIRTFARYAVPFRYENNTLHRQAMPATVSNRSWKETFGVEGGCLDTGSAGVRIQVPRIQGRRNNSRKLVVRLPSELPIEESDKHTVASPVVEVKQKHFNENDKMVVELPVVTKVKEDAESKRNAEFVVMRQNGQGKPIEEVPESDWTHCPETSLLRFEVKRLSFKSLFFAIIRCMEGKIWNCIQITLHLSLYGPPQLEQRMCLHAIISCKSSVWQSQKTCQDIVPWTSYWCEISQPQKVELKAEACNGWKVDNSRVDPIYIEDMRSRQVYILRSIPLTNKQQQMEQFTLNLTMVATEDHREYHHSCTSPNHISSAHMFKLCHRLFPLGQLPHNQTCQRKRKSYITKKIVTDTTPVTNGAIVHVL
ncbi:uncharacterized protein [Ptychodera flava]|uniref:uncharacterized protein n=1 Tax=Ptychodera flava TaxID=63121 RepID=UPI003969DFE9